MTTRVGILSLEGTRIRGVGSMYDPTQVREPRFDVQVNGATSTAIVERPEGLIESYCDAAVGMVTQGADLVTSNCGLSMYYQSAVSEATGTPTVMSSLIMLPLLWRVYGGRLGLLTYDAGALTSNVLREQCGWTDEITPVVGDVRGYESWVTLEEDASIALPLDQMKRDLRDVVRGVVDGGGDRAMLIECTAMLPLRDEVRRVARIPIFDITDVIRLVRQDGHDGIA